MKKIEQQMLDAIRARRDWQKGNTCVVFSDHSGNPYLDATIWLDGNPIAEIQPLRLPGANAGALVPNLDTLRRWSTPTTKSRLRALGVNVATRAGVTYVDGAAI